MESHMFQCVNQAAVHEELEDETRRLCDVRPFLPVLKLVMRNCGRAERLLDSKIGVLIGKGEVPSKTFPQFKVTDYHAGSHTHCSFPDWSVYCATLAFPVKKSTCELLSRTVNLSCTQALGTSPGTLSCSPYSAHWPQPSNLTPIYSWILSGTVPWDRSGGLIRHVSDMFSITCHFVLSLVKIRPVKRGGGSITTVEKRRPLSWFSICHSSVQFGN